MSTGDRDKDDGGTWTRRRTRMLTKMRPSSSPSRPSPPTPSSSPSSDLSLWSVDNDKEEEEDGDENAKGGHLDRFKECKMSVALLLHCNSLIVLHHHWHRHHQLGSREIDGA